MTGRQLAIFLACYTNPAPYTAKELAGHLSVNIDVVSKALDRLEGHGLVRRTENHRDRRSLLVEQTAAGNNFIQRLRRSLARSAP